ncbi:MAG: hypothetical protein CMP51_01895 [Flavobacteriales bacterium]|nr:hypothetical protein [Flavobacteriales bacterium]
MKKISFWFLMTFSFFFIGELLWSLKLLGDFTIFGDDYIHDIVINLMFSFCSVFGLIGSFLWYKKF